MSLIAIIVDFITLGFYFLQLKVLTQPIFVIGLIVQTVAVLFLLVLVFSYKGQRYSKFSPIGYRYLTIRYGIVVLSLLINGFVLFLYILNITGRNDVIFSSF